jgi:hypothetical protein
MYIPWDRLDTHPQTMVSWRSLLFWAWEYVSALRLLPTGIVNLSRRFRLINVVLETPPEMPPHQRIGNALGEVGHLSLAVAFQNLALIYFCSRLVSPWVADFCIFAAVTLVFDFVYHITFFVAVLSVDVQRMELSDSLERVELTQKMKKTRQERQSWLTALRERVLLGVWPFSPSFSLSIGTFSIAMIGPCRYMPSAKSSCPRQESEVLMLLGALPLSIRPEHLPTGFEFKTTTPLESCSALSNLELIALLLAFMILFLLFRREHLVVIGPSLQHHFLRASADLPKSTLFQSP